MNGSRVPPVVPDENADPSPPVALAGGTAFNLATMAVQAVCGLALSVIVARSLPAAAFGRYTYLGWVASGLVGFLGSAASPALAVRLVAESLGRGEPGRARRLLRRLTWVVALSVLGLGLGLCLLDRATGLLRATGAWHAVLVLALGQSLAALLSLGLQGAHRFDRVLLCTAPATVATTLAAAWLARAGASPAAILLASGAGALVGAALLATAFVRAVPAGADRGGPRLADVSPYFLSVTALGFVDLVVWQKSELFFLQRFRSDEEMALYSVAFTLANAAARMAPTALAGVLTPAFSALAGRAATRDTAALFRRATTWMGLLGGTLAVIALAVRPTLLGLFGHDYRAAAPLLPWLVAALAVGNVSGVASAVFHGHGRADLLLKMGLVLAAVNVGLDLALIPSRGPLGAAIACATAQSLSLPIAAGLVLRGFGLSFPFAALVRIAGAAVSGHLLGGLARGAEAGLAGDVRAALAALAGGALAYALLGGTRDLRPRVEVIDPPPPFGDAPPVTVVVPTKNRADFLRRCLASVLDQQGPAREVIVVDSSDDNRTELLLASEFPSVRRVRVRHMPNNRHFAKNQGIRLARGEVLCFLDDDAFVQPGWLERITSHYRDPEVGAVGGRIVDEIFARGDTGEPVGTIEPNGRLHLNFTRHTGGPVAVDHLIGCNLSFRAEALARVGGYDLAYGGPNFMEETDLCIRVGRAGYRLLFDPDAVADHVNAPRDGGLDRRQALDHRLQFWSARSRAYFAWKLLPRRIAVLRYNALGFLKQLLGEAIARLSAGHLGAFFLQTAGLALGSLDWVRAGFPRVPPPAKRLP